jgi:hypothetical protein
MHMDMVGMAYVAPQQQHHDQPLYYMDKLASTASDRQSPLIPTVIAIDGDLNCADTDRLAPVRRRRCSGNNRQMQCQVRH